MYFLKVNGQFYGRTVVGWDKLTDDMSGVYLWQDQDEDYRRTVARLEDQYGGIEERNTDSFLGVRVA